MITRRELIAGAAALSGIGAQAQGAGPYAKKHVTPPDWYQRAMRWLTMNLVQDDPGKVDLDFWLNYLKRAHVDAASWNSGGNIAFYPTKIPFHKRNERLGDSDPLGYLVEGCRRMGLIVTARVEHHATYAETAEGHPEWISRYPDGSMRRHWASPHMFLTCTLGPYNEIFMTDVMKEIVTMYGVDGFNHNRWAPQVMCYCDWCRNEFRRDSGLELPKEQGPKDPNWGRYLVWRENRIFELWDGWNAAIRKINPNAFVLPGIGAERDRLNMSKVRQRARTLYLDYQGRRGLNAPWMAGKKGKELSAVLLEKPTGLTFSVGFEEPYRWKDSVTTGEEMKVWVSVGAAHGFRPKMAKFAGTLYDRRWLQPVAEIYSFLAKAEPYLQNVWPPLATVGFLHSQQTARFYPAASRGCSEEDYSKGFYHAMIEARMPTDTVHEDLLEESALERFRVLVLPNSACLSDRQCEQIRRYVHNGGSLVATFETSLYDEWGKRREKFGLGDLFGVEPAGPAQGPQRNSYLRFAPGPRHPIVEGYGEDALRMINGIWRQPVTATVPFPDQPLLLVAPYPDLPMEEVYPRDMDKNVPELYLREVGKGRVVYIPFDSDRTFWEVMDPDHGRLLANAVRWACRNDLPVHVEGPGILDLAVWRQKNSLAVHLVNLTNPMMMKGPIRQIFPVGEQRVRVRLPEGKRARTVRLLAAGVNPRFTQDKGWLTVTVPSVAVHEIVAIEV